MIMNTPYGVFYLAIIPFRRDIIILYTAEDNNMDVRKISQEMSIVMGATMSCVLSLVGLIQSGNFTLVSYLTSVIMSFMLCTIVGLIIPAKKISNSLAARMQLQPGSIRARLLDSLVTTLVYSPLMTFLMVYMAYRQATSHGARINFGHMLLKSELISFAVAFVVSFIISPIYLKLIFKRNGIDVSNGKNS